jgi:hypothetical protein
MFILLLVVVEQRHWVGITAHSIISVFAATNIAIRTYMMSVQQRMRIDTFRNPSGKAIKKIITLV